MNFELIPLLHKQRGLYDLPRNAERFRRYIYEVTGGRDEAVAPPLVILNPMGKRHVAERLDALIALDAEAIAADALAEASRRLRDEPGTYRVGLTLADDFGGGWTDRHLNECHYRFDRPAASLGDWLAVVFWTGDAPATARSVREEVLSTVYRTAHAERFGWPRTLKERMIQEGRAAAFAGMTGPSLDPDDLAYSREVIRPHLDGDDFTVVFACLYGDAAAKSVGYDPMGLLHRAGYAVALADARAEKSSPEESLALFGGRPGKISG